MLSWDDNDDEVLEESHERKEMQNSLKKPLNFASLSSASPFSSDFKKLEGPNEKQESNKVTQNEDDDVEPQPRDLDLCLNKAFRNAMIPSESE